jgi:hypothetical protein
LQIPDIDVSELSTISLEELLSDDEESAGFTLDELSFVEDDDSAGFALDELSSDDEDSAGFTLDELSTDEDDSIGFVSLLLDSTGLSELDDSSGIFELDDSSVFTELEDPSVLIELEEMSFFSELDDSAELDDSSTVTELDTPDPSSPQDDRKRANKKIGPMNLTSGIAFILPILQIPVFHFFGIAFQNSFWTFR